jgi:WD40 repeat protein
MSGKERKGVFLSYARQGGGEEFATNLRKRLQEEAPDIDIKQDRLLLEGGVGWWKQLREAIESVEFVVLVMTSSVMRSENVRKEWQYARQEGVCVYPVKGAPDFDLHFEDLPRWMRKAHFFDLDKEWESFLAKLRKGCNALRVPFMSPDLPENFIGRPNEFGKLKDLLLSPDRKEPIAITTALSGMGGFGKTTLAVALCHDDDIILNFDEGILWVTLGQNPNLMENLVTVYAALTGDRRGFANEEDASFHLGQELEERACLLVIDNLWDKAHLRPFLRGKGCARLLTTRIAGIAPNAPSVNVDKMREAESLALLTTGLSELSFTQARKLSQRLGEWPFALELTRAMIQQRVEFGDSADHAAEQLAEMLERRGLRGLDGQSGDTIDNILTASLTLLGEQEQRRLFELSVFPKNQAIPLSVAKTLWNLDKFDCEQLAQRFARLHFLRMDLKNGSLRLHDVIRNWLDRNTDDPVTLHNRLVDAWPDSMRLPEKYAWRWLPWHLRQAGRDSELEELLWNSAWLRAKLDRTDVNAIVTDFDQLNPKLEVTLIRDALRLSSHILAKDPSQFVSQLTGRLLPYREHPAIRRFIESLENVDFPWLRLLTPTLDPPGAGLLRTLVGHSDSVNGVAPTPDGNRVISASSDCELMMWDLQTGECLQIFVGHSNSVNGVAVTPDGTRAISASADHTLKLWDLETGKELLALIGHSDSVNGVAVTPDGCCAVSASADRTLKVWNLEAHKEPLMLIGHTNGVLSIAWSPDSSRLTTGSLDSTARVWDTKSRKTLITLRGHSEPVTSVAWSPDGKYIATGSKDKRAKIWNSRTGKELLTLNGHEGTVSEVAWNPDSRLLATASEDRTAKVWEIDKGTRSDEYYAKELLTLSGHSDPVTSVAWSPNGSRVATGSWDHTARVWDRYTNKELIVLSDHSGAVTSVAWNPDGKWLATASENDTLKVWDIEMGQELLTLGGSGKSLSHVAWSPDGACVATVNEDDIVNVWDTSTGKEVLTFGGYGGVAWSPDGRKLATASNNNTAKLWEAATGRAFLTLRGHLDSVTGVAVTSDGRRAISSSEDRMLRVWDLRTGGMVLAFVAHSGSVKGVATATERDIVNTAIGSDPRAQDLAERWNLREDVEMGVERRRVISASEDHLVKIWDLESGLEVRTLVGHSDSVNGLSVSQDDKRVISVSDRTLKVWNLATGQNTSTVIRQPSVINGVAMCPDGRRAISAAKDSTLKIWDLEANQNLHKLIGHSGMVKCVAVSPEKRLAVTASVDKTLKVWNVETGEEEYSLSGHARSVNCVAISFDGQLLISASDDQTLKVWDVNTRSVVRTISHSDTFCSVSFSFDGKYAISASSETLIVWSLVTTEKLRELRCHSGRVCSVAVMPDARHAISASSDQTLIEWDLETGSNRTLVGHSGGVNWVALTPDGRHAVSASNDKTLKVWNLETGQEQRTLIGHMEKVWGVGVAPDGRSAVSASEDKTLRIWDLETGERIATFSCESAAICCAFTDDRTIIAGDAGGRIYVLKLEPPRKITEGGTL